MAYSTAAQAREYMPKVDTNIRSDADLLKDIENSDNSIIKPIFSKQYDLTDSTITTNLTFVEFSAKCGALQCMKTIYSANQRSGLVADIEQLEKDVDEMKRQFMVGGYRL
jgi:hypothetical protein